jgi:hypothetical protein
MFGFIGDHLPDPRLHQPSAPRVAAGESLADADPTIRRGSSGLSFVIIR